MYEYNMAEKLDSPEAFWEDLDSSENVISVIYLYWARVLKHEDALHILLDYLFYSQHLHIHKHVVAEVFIII